MKVLVVVAHPDDELLGVGPLLVKLVEDGHKVSVVVFTENSVRHGAPGVSLQSVATAAEALGYTATCWGLGDQTLDRIRFSDLTSQLEHTVDVSSFDVVLTHSSADLNLDHRLVSEVCRVVFRRYATLAEFQTLSSSEFALSGWLPNWHVPVSDMHVARAWEAFSKAYPLEVAPYPHPRSKEGYSVFYAAQGLPCLSPYACALRVVTLRGVI